MLAQVGACPLTDAPKGAFMMKDGKNVQTKCDKLKLAEGGGELGHWRFLDCSKVQP